MAGCPAVRSFRREVSLRLRRACAERDSRLFRRHRSWRHAAVAQSPCRSQRQRRRPECTVWRRSPRRICRGNGRCRYGGPCIPERRAPGRAGDSVHVVVGVLVVRVGSAVRDGVEPGGPPRPLRVKRSSRRAQPVRRSRIAAHRPPEDGACATPRVQPRRLRGSARGRPDLRRCVYEFRHDDRTRARSSGFATARFAAPRTPLKVLRPRPVVPRVTKDRTLSITVDFRRSAAVSRPFSRTSRRGRHPKRSGRAVSMVRRRLDAAASDNRHAPLERERLGGSPTVPAVRASVDTDRVGRFVALPACRVHPSGAASRMSRAVTTGKRTAKCSGSRWVGECTWMSLIPKLS